MIADPVECFRKESSYSRTLEWISPQDGFDFLVSYFLQDIFVLFIIAVMFSALLLGRRPLSVEFHFHGRYWVTPFSGKSRSY